MIKQSDIIADFHTHTVASGHAYSTVIENLTYGKNRGLQFVAITDHYFGKGDKIDIGNEVARIRDLTNRTKQGGSLSSSGLISGVELNFGQRTDIAPAILDAPFRLAGLHGWFWGIEHQDIDALAREVKIYIDKKYINAVAHPERQIERLAKGKYGFELTQAVKDYFKWLVEYCKEHRVFLELNECSLTYSLADYEQTIEYWLKLARENGNPITLGTDSHICTEVGVFDRSIELLNKVEYPIELILNCNEHLIKNICLK